jgi:hypothetical protein
MPGALTVSDFEKNAGMRVRLEAEFWRTSRQRSEKESRGRARR